MRTIFPENVPQGEWTEFLAEGFAKPVCGIVFRDEQVTAGVPLGGIGTGCVDLNGNGCLGRASLFNSFAPPRELNLPFLGVVVGDRAYCLTTSNVPGVRNCRRIRYWGHYPVADLEYELDAPLSFALRAWAPFFPGDAESSNAPVVVFEVRARNPGSSRQQVQVVLAFPGPSAQESNSATYTHSDLQSGAVQGACVEWNGGNYVLACPAGIDIKTGGSLKGSQWNGITDGLPERNGADPGCSLSAECVLDADSLIDLPFALAWHVPRWTGSHAHGYRHAYAERFAHAREAAESGLSGRQEWRQRIFAWQQEIYSETALPVWLRDQLVNVLHTIAKDSFWASQSIPRQTWYGLPGLFALTESPRTTPHICNPSDWYGSLPLVFFFPELMRSLLRAYVHFQLETGEIPLGIGENSDFAGQPVYQVLHPMNSCVHIHLVDRLWQRDLDSGILREFYPSALKALVYMQSLDGDGDGLPELDADPIPNQFYGDWPWYGLAMHVAGFWLAALRMMERMAAACGDSSTESLCRDWSRRASQAVEEKLWNDSGYLLYHDGVTGRSSDTVLANQLAGQWCTRLHNLPGLYPSDHVLRTMQTVLETCARATGAGLMNATRIDGKPDGSGGRQSDGIFTGECIATAATMIYEGRASDGMEAARRMMEAIVLHSCAGWELPNILDANGKIVHGDDFYQMMILWALPLAVRGEGIREICASGSLMDRILRSRENCP